MFPLQLPRSLPLKYWSCIPSGEEDEIAVAVEEHVAIGYCRRRREHVACQLCTVHFALIRARIQRAVELVLKNVGRGLTTGRRLAVGFRDGECGRQETHSRHHHHVATIHLREEGTVVAETENRALFRRAPSFRLVIVPKLSAGLLLYRVVDTSSRC